MDTRHSIAAPRDIFEYLGYSREEFDISELPSEQIHTLVIEARTVFSAFKRLHPEAFLKSPFEDLPDDHPTVQQWMAEEVLPSIREFGIYTIADTYLHCGEITFEEYVRYSYQIIAELLAEASETIH